MNMRWFRSRSTVRQFAGLCLFIFDSLAGWEYLGGTTSM